MNTSGICLHRYTAPNPGPSSSLFEWKGAQISEAPKRPLRLCCSAYQRLFSPCFSVPAHTASAGFWDGGEGSLAFSIRHTTSPHDKEVLCRSLPRPQCGTPQNSPGCSGISFIWCYFLISIGFHFGEKKNRSQVKIKTKESPGMRSSRHTERKHTNPLQWNTVTFFFFLFLF